MIIKNLSIMESENLQVAYQTDTDYITIHKKDRAFGGSEMKLTFEEVQKLVNIAKMLAMTSERRQVVSL